MGHPSTGECSCAGKAAARKIRFKSLLQHSPDWSWITLLKAAELENPRERGLDALEGPFGHCSNVLNSPGLNTGSNNSTGETQLLERKKKRPCATLGCADDSDNPGCASSSAAHHLHRH